MHEKQYIHLGIKPTTFLINIKTNQLILTNFESCQALDNSKTKYMLRIGEYDAPEFSILHPSNPTPAADVFSLGIMLFNVC